MVDGWPSCMLAKWVINETLVRILTMTMVQQLPRTRMCHLTAVVHPDAQRCVHRNTPQNTDSSQWHTILEE